MRRRRGQDIRMIILLFLGIFSPSWAIMNNGGVPYAISNPPGSSPNWQGTSGTYSTDFEKNVDGKVEHFDVYGEVQTLYSQVYWTRNNPIDLPPELVKRFKGKVMAITGYEVDQVVHKGSQKGSSSTSENLGGFSCFPDCENGDESIPIYNAYNHHYFSWITGADAELLELDEPIFIPNPTNTGFKSNASHGYPTNIVFKENPGGEFRKSYHGYPSGYAQLIHSPTQWIVEPMQIDTHNRNFSITDQVGLKPSFLPKMVLNNMTDLKGGLSPLIECPCSDRITKTSVESSLILTSGTCKEPLQSLQDCIEAIEKLGINVSSSQSVQVPNWPSGCNLWPKDKEQYSTVFNSMQTSKTCGNGGDIGLTGSANIGPKVTLKIQHDSKTATLTLSGPSEVWFGLGFAASSMNDQPYAIIVEGVIGNVTERKLANHAPGKALQNSIKVISDKVVDEIRTLVLSRPVKGLTPDHFNLPTSPGDLAMISAVGNSPAFNYHQRHDGGKITLLPSEEKSCICKPASKDYITYMDSTLPFNNYDCLDAPRSDMAKHGDGTGRQVPNQACHMQTYHGGLQCCRHSWFLTDRDQDSMIDKSKVDTYFLKWRYYFQEYKPASENSPASHKHLHHWVFLIDAQVNDYEEDNTEYGKASIGKITAHLRAKDIGLEDLGTPTDDRAPPVPKNYTKITPLVMTPHCHAPSCIRQEFWNADTGEIICNMTANYGTEDFGSTNEVFNEKDYITILPCIYGFQPGLQFPFDLDPETNITAVKYFNNTFRHLGQMAQWTGLMVYDTDPY